MTHDETFERVARDWLELGPSDAPDRAIQAVLLQIESTSQDRDLWIPWRTTRMTRSLALAAALVVVAAGIGVGVGFLGLGQGRDAGVAPPSSTATAALSAVWPYIPDGTYLGPEQSVAAITGGLESDPGITQEGRDAILDTILGIRGGTTYQTRIEVLGDRMTVGIGVDGRFAPEVWAIEDAGDGRMRATLRNSSPVFRVEGCDGRRDPCSFSLEATTPAASDVETFVRRVVLETGVFVPQT